MGLNLLEKTELWVNEITLANANLSDMADAVAEQLGLDKGKVMVVDVRPRHITLTCWKGMSRRLGLWERSGQFCRRWPPCPGCA